MFEALAEIYFLLLIHKLTKKYWRDPNLLNITLAKREKSTANVQMLPLQLKMSV